MNKEVDYTIFKCPITNEDLLLADESALKRANQSSGKENLFSEGLMNSSQTYFFPIKNDILFLFTYYAVPLKENDGHLKKMHFDKQRIFNYFSEIDYHEFEGQQIYSDADKFVDFRPFVLEYTQHGFSNVRQYIHQAGKYCVDAGCGPVAFKEYVALAEGFDCRICIDMSANALLQAKKNLAKYNQCGIFICADITNIPLKENIADAVICQHALFHVQKDLQLKAMQELVRIAKPETKIAIVYDWFYHSMLMNITLGPFQLYRIARHYFGKLYASIFKKNKLYFYAHSREWFYQNNPGKKMNMYVWRSLNKHFSDIYIHKKLGGRKLINYIWKMEKKYPERMGRIGEYPVIVIEK
jgi:ubiquinone/menaquinone biosynthesis C-methylase UbiE